MKVMLKGCARCGGDLMRARTDPDTETVTCLQCGYERDLVPAPAWARLAKSIHEAAATQATLKDVAAKDVAMKEVAA